MTILKSKVMFNNWLAKGFIAYRVAKKRYGIKSSDCFYQVHTGLKSYYIEKASTKRKLSNSFGR